MAPRTEAPERRSGCSRVARVRATASATRAGLACSAASRTIWRSCPASWYPTEIRQVRSYSAIDSRDVPTESYGFMAATSRKLGSAPIRPSLGTLISPSDMTVSSTLIVSSGTRLSSSTYSRPPSRMARTSGPSEKFSGRYPCSSTRAGSNAPTRRAGVSSALPSTRTNSVCLERATCRSKVDLPVPGGPSSRMWAPDASAARTSSSSRWRPTTCFDTGSVLKDRGARSVLVDDDAADVLAREEILVALVDLVQGVSAGDDLVQLEVAGLVQAEDLRDVVGRVAVAEQAAHHALAEQGQDGPRQLDGRVHQLVQPGHHDDAALADRGEPGADDFGGHQVDGQDGRVGPLAPGHLGDSFLRLLGGGERVGRAELHRLLALVFQRVDRDDVLRAGVASALHRVDPDPADAVDRDGVARGDLRGVHGGAPSGGYAAADKHRLIQGQVVIDLDG